MTETFLPHRENFQNYRVKPDQCKSQRCTLREHGSVLYSTVFNYANSDKDCDSVYLDIILVTVIQIAPDWSIGITAANRGQSVKVNARSAAVNRVIGGLGTIPHRAAEIDDLDVEPEAHDHQRGELSRAISHSPNAIRTILIDGIVARTQGDAFVGGLVVVVVFAAGIFSAHRHAIRFAVTEFEVNVLA